MNQIDIPDYQYHLDCNTKRMARLAFLEIKFVSQSEISTFSLILFSKIEKFCRIKELFKVNQIDIPDYQYHLGCNTKKNGPPSFPRKKVRISIGNLDFFAYTIFKNIEISSGQGVVQIEPNSV